MFKTFHAKKNNANIKDLALLARLKCECAENNENKRWRPALRLSKRKKPGRSNGLSEYRSEQRKREKTKKKKERQKAKFLSGYILQQVFYVASQWRWCGLRVETGVET